MEPLWTPSAQPTQMAAFMRQTGHTSYADLHQWSIDEPALFWKATWECTAVQGEPGAIVVEDFDHMPGARWFPQGRLNFAENLLRAPGNREAIVFQAEDQPERRLTRTELADQVARLAAALRADGVSKGDRVAAWLPNVPETVIIMLAAASLGAIFSSCSPDFGVEGVVDRFGQIKPVILFAATRYQYDGKTFETLEKARQIASRLPTVKRVILVDTGDWSAFLAPQAQLHFEALPFHHPLYILYSSGTTGVPNASSTAQAEHCSSI